MRINQPRIPPLDDDAFSAEDRARLNEIFKEAPVYNVFRTLARSPNAFKRFMGWGGYILSSDNDLNARDRELVILRTGYNWRSGYEWAQHERIGRDSGLTAEEISAIKRGPGDPLWNKTDRALLTATDELTGDGFITDETWRALDHLSDKQRMDLVMTVGQYTQVAMMLNTFGVQLDPGFELDPDLTVDPARA